MSGNDATSDRTDDGLAGSLDAFTHRLDYPLFVVTATSAGGERSGCLAGFVTQCSMIPVRFLVCISKLNRTYFVAERASSLALHQLGRDQVEMASLFGERTGDAIDKFQHCQWSPGRTGSPILAECAAWLEGPILHHFSVGDHQAFEIGPVGAGDGTRQGLLTHGAIPLFDPGHPAA
jgi:flavin reductase (DIM6/NTAB) family NADH-FMN oxidoreductase RutF